MTENKKEMISTEVTETLIRFYGGNETAVRKNMTFEVRTGRVIGRYTNDVPAQNGGYFYEGVVSCLPDGSGVIWEISHHYSKY